MININAVILGAGKGTRMKSVDTPKVMYPINGKPMIGYIVDMLKGLEVNKAIIVVGFQGQKIVDYLGNENEYEFVWQKEQLGTGHALMEAKPLLQGQPGITIVLNGDNPFFKVETIKRMADLITERSAKMAVSSVELDPSFSFGRIVTDEEGHITNIIEAKNATPEQLELTWMNAGLYAFDNKWLCDNVDKITKDELSGEYYLTELVEIANRQGDKVLSIPVTHSDEAVGINTPDNLKIAQEILNRSNI
jgi:bifunctional UDP-N-acetylglucosamine pyrophosphorylase/glucosamine-1-phosphate N-acetyltransferase